MERVGAERVQRTKLSLDLSKSLGIEQVAQLLLPEQLAQEVAVERERLRAPLRRGLVALVHELRDVVEEQRRGERRAVRRLDLDERDLAPAQRGQDLDERRDVEHVLQALAVGLEDDREGAEALRHLEEALRLQALLPERRALPRSAARDEQRPPGVLAEARAEERRAGELAHDGVLDALRVEHRDVARRRVLGVG